MIKPRDLRTLPDTGADLSKGLVIGKTTRINMPLVESKETAILFDKKYHGWRYDGKDFYEDEPCVPNPRGEHYMEELRDDVDNPYMENYVAIGHCPYGLVGDALLVNGVAVEITDVELEEVTEKGVQTGWQWGIDVKLIES